MKTRLLPLLVTACFLAITACGGGDGASNTGAGTTVAAPSITTQPATASAAVGSSASFSVVATGGGTLSYQWYYNGSAVAGATGTSHTITAVTTAHAGNYHVVVTNSAGSATSNTAALTVTSTGGGGSSGTGESWNIATGANPADAIANYDFAFKVSIDLSTLSITTSSARLLSGTTTAGVTPITLDGTQVITITQDALGLSIDSSDLPADTLVEFALSGSYAGSVTLLGDSVTRLALNGAIIASPDGPALNIQSGERTFIVLGDGSLNRLTDSTQWSSRSLPDGSAMDLKATLFGEGALILSGGGQLEIEASTRHALASDDHVRLTDGTLSIVAHAKDGIRANDAFILDGGTLSIATDSGAGKGIKVEGKEDDDTPLGFIAINAGTLSINSYDKAITASWEAEDDAETTTTADDPDPRVTINGGTLVISTFGTPFETATDSLSPEGIESKTVLTINGGNISIDATDDALNAGTSIVINDGRVYARSSRNDAVDSNGTLTINGGLIVAEGATGPEGGFDCDQNTFKVTGGIFVGTGGRNSSVTRSASTQNTVALQNGTANSQLVIRDASGKVAFAYTLPKASPAILIGTPALQTGTTYTVASGGTVAASTENFHGLLVGATTHSGGTTLSTFTP